MSTTQMSWRLVAGSAAIATAAVGTVMAPGAHGAQAPAPTSISIRAVHQKIAPGGSDEIRGNLHIKGAKSLNGRIVSLEAEPTGTTTFTPVGNAAANANGGITLTVMPEVTTKYRWHYDGATDARARNSGVVKVVVRVPTGTGTATRKPTSLSIRAAQRVTGKTGHDTIRGLLLSRHKDLAGRSVVLLSKTAPATKFTFSAQHRTSSKGRVAFDVTPTSATSYELSFLGTNNFRPSHSGVVKVGVRPSVSISATPRRVDPGASTAISGAVTYAGAPATGKVVDLLAKPAKGKHAFTVVGTGTTAADGTVTIMVTPSGNTIYKLRVNRTGDTPVAYSRSIVVGLKYASSLSIRGKSSGSNFVVSGVLRGHSMVVKHAAVVLMAAAPGTTTFTQVASGQTDAHGAVRFIEPGVTGTTYRLDFAGNNTIAACKSGTVVD